MFAEEIDEETNGIIDVVTEEAIGGASNGIVDKERELSRRERELARREKELEIKEREISRREKTEEINFTEKSSVSKQTTQKRKFLKDHFTMK